MSKTTLVNKIVRKLYIEIDNNLIEVKKNLTIDHYPKETLIFENKLSKGSRAGESEYMVKLEDYIPSPRSASTVKSSMLADMQSGMSVEELAKKYNVELQ